MNTGTFLSAAVLLASLAPGIHAQNKLTSFTATALTGETVTERQLLGRPFILIVTPSKDAAADTRLWAQALRAHLDVRKIVIRDIVAIDLPFFMSEQEALRQARKTIPKRYHNQTYLLAEGDLETSLYIPPSSNDAYVFVFNAQGQVMARVSGQPTEASVSAVETAVRPLLGQQR